ncbi:hypothetical protein A2872_03275 [Candidatus Gottesmanbacteria bacterium RIFCSPHIGHO2_01_FULL_42_12]|uniref:Uncharacterized protein n=1 Tax=Candidatus Gottesmanbacteria bacterium RIFCSPHIGHO2_01_FULL_42_12 TaxID=1798377 RepID=A0A1F5Z5W8_9BACT|nr:MAG: hypothetical protein A2872_03275 [Candidatus Gottesmanbacteria bacterium RIFCSPHIGHO2_01_FULL_42_12]
MEVSVDSPVQVVFNSRPLELVYRGRSIKITQVGLHHKYYEGRILHHVYSVASETAFYRLNFNTENLIWILEAYELQQ